MTSLGWAEWWPYATSPLTWLMVLCGLCVGSFLNVCIYRLPRGSFWQEARSRCPHCKALIPGWLNVPLVSFALLKARARCCNNPISWRYPLVEALTGLSFGLLSIKFPFATSVGLVNLDELVRFLHAGTFAALMIVCSFIDIELRIIPDKISLPMILSTPLVAYLHPELSLKSGLFGVLAGGGVIYAVAWTYILLRRREGIGMGDVKLLAAIGGWLGYQAVLPSLFFGSIIGSVYGILAMLVQRRISLQAELPFGPFLAIGAMIHLSMNMRIQELLLF